MHEFVELLGVKRLCAVAQRVIRMMMDFHDQPVRARGDSGSRHGRHQSRRPMPCDGSAIIGRCESFFTTGMAEMSIVLRVYVS